jgi:hypothetical protein
MRFDRTLTAAAMLAAVTIAGCGGGGEIAKPFVDDAARSAERGAVRDAASAAGNAARSDASRAATSLRERSRDALSSLERLAADDEGARAAICRHIDVLELNSTEPAERAYTAYQQVASELMPFSEFVDMIDAVDHLTDGDLDELAHTAGCL